MHERLLKLKSRNNKYCIFDRLSDIFFVYIPFFFFKKEVIGKSKHEIEKFLVLFLTEKFKERFFDSYCFHG